MGGAQRKLTEILKQQQQQKKDLADQEKQQERHLLRQIDKIATLMARSSALPTPQTSAKTGPTKLDKLPPDPPNAAPIAIMDAQLPAALLEEPTAHQGVSSAPSDDPVHH